MKIISYNLIGKIPLPKDAVIRINLAWSNLETAKKKLKFCKYPVYLDYPSGRTKPPVPSITLIEAIGLANEHKVKYFAVSNIEGVVWIKEMKKLVKAEVVPKIETVRGANNIKNIAKEVKTIMLDKDDLYLDCKGKNFDKLVQKVRNAKVKVLELAGVVFNCLSFIFLEI